MSEADPAEVAARSLRVLPERFRKDLETAAIERPVEREGLPPNYRMRADAHYVDQLVARSPDLTVRFVPVHEIDGGGMIDSAPLGALTESIRAHGVLQPLLVRRDDQRYRIIAGRRRLAAATLAGLATVPCIVHQADGGRAEEIARAENVRGGAGVPAAAEAAGGEGVLDQLAVEIDGIGAAAALLSGQAPTGATRVALDLVKSQAARAAWLLRAAGVLERRAHGEPRLCLLGPMIERIREDLAPEMRLSGVTFELCVPDWNVSAVVDERAATTGVTGALLATFGLLEQHQGANVTVMVVGASGTSVTVDVVQEAATVPAGLASRFFDAGVARPGGRPAVLGALAARAAARLHGGDASFVAGESRGSTLRVTFGRPR